MADCINAIMRYENKPVDVTDKINAGETPINILKADTRNVGGIAKGEMLLGLPAGSGVEKDFIEYFRERGLVVTEVKETEVKGHV